MAGPTFARDVAAAYLPLRRQAMLLTRDLDRAGDLAMSTIARALQKPHLFSEGTNLMAWLSTMQRNLFVNELRKRSRFTVMDDTVLATLPANNCPAPLRIEARQVMKLVGELPAAQRKILLMAADGMAYEEIAAELGITCGTVKSRLSRARREVLSHLELRGANA